MFYICSSSLLHVAQLRLTQITAVSCSRQYCSCSLYSMNNLLVCMIVCHSKQNIQKKKKFMLIEMTKYVCMPQINEASHLTTRTARYLLLIFTTEYFSECMFGHTRKLIAYTEGQFFPQCIAY